MIVSNGEEQIMLPSEDASEVSKSTSLDLNPDSFDGSTPGSTVYMDVGVVPEHQKDELEHLISNLESIKSMKSLLFLAFGFESVK